jgi:hypothetical protein
LEFGIGAQALDYIRNGMSGPYIRGNLNMTYDTSIGNRAPLLSGGSGEGTGGRSGEYVRAYRPDPVFRNRRIERRGGLDYKAEGGEVTESPSLFSEIYDKGLESGTASYLGISPEDISWAESIGQKNKLNRGNSDAARHVALGWLASKTKNPELAKFFADLREYGPFGGGMPSRRMDLENNNIGFSLPAESKEDAEEIILRLIEDSKVNMDDPQGYAAGGGVETLAPRAKAMFNKPVDIRQGVGSYAQYIRRA